jgi:hypothetical protein
MTTNIEIKNDINTEINSEITEVLENLYSNTIFKLTYEKKESILFINDSSNNIFYDISNNVYPHAFDYKCQITIDYMGMCFANYGNYPSEKDNYFYILVLDVSPINKNYMLMKPGHTNDLNDRKDSVITQYLPLHSKSYILYWSKDVPIFVEKKLHKNLHEKYPELAFVTLKPNKKKDKEKKSTEIYIFHQNIMNECYDYIEKYRINSEKSIKKLEFEEKTKQEVEKTKQEVEKTKQKDFEEKTKQEVEKTKQEVEKTKQTKEKTKQMTLELEILKLKPK